MPEITETPPRTLAEVRKTEIGFHILQVPYWSRPDFDYEQAIIGMSESEIQTELHCNWLASTGLRVYPEFRHEMHVSTADLEYDPGSPLYVGMDWGLCPAACIGQLTAFGQLFIFPSLHPEEREYEGVYAFAEKLADHLLKEYAAPHGMELNDLPLVVIGDPAGRARISQSVAGKKSKEVASCFDVLYRGLELDLGVDGQGKRVTEKMPGWGWRVIPGDVSNHKRQEAVRYRLKSLVHGLPALVIDHREEFLQSAMMGGYHFRQYSDGTYGREPEKNIFSHLSNSLEYLCTRLFARPARRPEDEDRPKAPPFCSQASRSHRFG